MSLAWSCLGIWCVALNAHCQGTFQNLGFESAIVSPGEFGNWQETPLENALPGWQASVAGIPISYSVYNATAVSSSMVGVFGHNPPRGPEPISGNYMGFIQAGYGGDVALYQTGLIPVGSRSFVFRTAKGMGSENFAPGIERFTVSLGGVPMPFYLLNETPTFKRWGTDVTSLAGSTAELRFSMASTYPNPISSPVVFLDFLLFSEFPVPEPSTTSTLLGAIALVAFWKLRTRNR